MIMRDKIYDRLYASEKYLNDLSQYTRRENIEIDGIPANIPQKELEKNVFGILKTIGRKSPPMEFRLSPPKKRKHQSIAFRKFLNE